MKYLYLLLSFVGLAAHAQCNDRTAAYSVASIEGGTVTLKKTGTLIKPNAPISSLKHEDYVFDPEGKVVMTLVSPQCGEMRIFQPAGWGQKAMQQLLYYYNWRSERRATGVRGGADGYVTEIQQRFAASTNPQQPNTFLILGPSARYAIDATVFPQTDTTFFAVTYHYRQDTITRQLPHVGNLVQIDSETLYRIGTQLADSKDVRNMTLGYVRKLAAGNPAVVVLCAFRPHFETDPVRIQHYQNLRKQP